VVTADDDQDPPAPATVIRGRSDQDVPGCVRALRAVHEQDGYPAVWPPDPGRWVTSAGADAAAWVAVDDRGTVLGHVAVRGGVHDATLPALTRRPGDLLLSVVRLFVDPAGRGRAAGAALMRAAVDYALARSLQPTLEVTGHDTAARRLYDRLGWACLGTRLASWTDSHGQRPVLYLYAWPADPGRPAE
jgi:GNAT superfamily N-acetyltransferase